MAANDFIVDTEHGEDTSLQSADFLIRSRFNSLSKTNKRIAGFVLDHNAAIANMTISQLSQKIHTSPSSITRFCQVFGFPGFPALRYYISKNPLSFSTDDKHIQPGESLNSVKNKMISLYLQMINESVSLMDESMLLRAARSIIAADNIIFFSQGGSAAAAEFGQVAFMQSGITCHCYNDMTMSKLAAAMMTPRDVAIGISFSGMAKIPVDALQLAHGRGACTICVTGFSNSHLMHYADIPFCYNCKIDDDMRMLNISRICEIGIIGLLHACILSLDHERMQQNADTLKRATLQGRYGVYTENV